MPKAYQRLLFVVLAASTLSAIRPVDYATWFFELFVGWIGLVALFSLHKSYRFSDLVCIVAALHFVVLALGAHYTYADMPLFNWLRDALGLERNHFDRVGHFMQGVTPALLTREVVLRWGGMSKGRLAALMAVSVALAFSGLYEILEWGWVAAFYPDSGPEWLGMQGDPWDAQKDMLMALLGSFTALALGPWHDRSIDSARSD